MDEVNEYKEESDKSKDDKESSLDTAAANKEDDKDRNKDRSISSLFSKVYNKEDSNYIIRKMTRTGTRLEASTPCSAICCCKPPGTQPHIPDWRSITFYNA